MRTGEQAEAVSSDGRQHRTALVLGGTGRVGSAVARELAVAGMTVTVQYQSRASAAQLILDELPGGATRHHVLQATLDGQDSVGELFDRVRARAGAPDVLVNALHCQFTPRPVSDSDWEQDWLPHVQSMRIHVEACRRAAAGMSERGFGRIILISGSLAARPMIGCAAYAAIKAGLHAYQRVLALEGGRSGITANVVAPCRIESGDGRTATDNPESWVDLNAAVEAVSALPDDPTAHEVAAAVRYLASPEAAAVTGQVLYLARGQVMTG